MPPLPLYRLEYTTWAGPPALAWYPSRDFPRTDYSGREVEAILTSPACRSMNYRRVRTNAPLKMYEVVFTVRVPSYSPDEAQTEALLHLPVDLRPVGPFWASIVTKEVPNANHSG